ncbi:hypothetical protein Tco_0843038 [Tanacetum coccineum]|uniref:Uncharacterized protein n=1 Tax=Tanacetum coccineum TaxID=301880 RepID=A0ABQ5B1U7_9ASTR
MLRTKNASSSAFCASKTQEEKANKSVATPIEKPVASDTLSENTKSYYKELYENTNQEGNGGIDKRCSNSGYTWTRPRSSMFKRRLIAADQASVFMAMTSDHNRSELGIQRHRMKRKVSKCHKVVRLGINPMIQPEPEDLPKDNPKLEIAVLRTFMSDTHLVFTMTNGNPSRYHQLHCAVNGGNGTSFPYIDAQSTVKNYI